MVFAKAALARYATRQAAREAAERLEHAGFVIRRIPASRPQRVVTGSTMGWCAFPAHKPEARLPSVLKNFLAKLHSPVTVGALHSLGIPPQALESEHTTHSMSDHIVVVSGTPKDVQRGVRMLDGTELLDLDLY